ncbi:ameloblastin [Myxocyprinus asiaticus]|uniref:ameloblastin n=1 Tax=Myxocyprinus asiaticus TaxID=70543 RepID=UPI00222205E2|nr:ameloblastin [Myxocyprinus asiaticus]
MVQAQHVPVLQQFQTESHRLPTGPQPQIAALANPWASQTNPNAGLNPLPAQFQYLPYAQQPQFSYRVPVFQPATSQQYPANAVPAQLTSRPSRPLTAQAKQHRQNAPQLNPNQPQQQQVPYFYMIPQIQQQMTGTYGGLSSEELQHVGHMGRVGMHMPVLRGNVFPFAAPQPVVPVSSLQPANTFHTNTFHATGMAYPATPEVQPPSVVALPASVDAVPATGGSHPNNGMMTSEITSPQDRDRTPCDQGQSAENPLPNNGDLVSSHVTSISVHKPVLPTAQPDPHHSDPNPVPSLFPTPEYKEAFVPETPPILSDTIDANTDVLP